MILKILPRHQVTAFKSLINYILNHEKTGEYSPVLITHNLRGDNKEEYIQEFYENEAYRSRRRKNTTYLYHEITSISSEDSNKVTPEILQDLAKKYIELRGKDALYLGFAHYDKEHVHIHFATSGLKYRQNKAHRLSREQLHSLKIEFQRYHQEKYPELDKSICEHGAGREYLTNKEYQYKARTNKSLIKEEVTKTVRECFNKAKTHNEFLELLTEANMPHYERKGTANGVFVDGRKYRFSRLGIEKHELERLHIDLTEEQRVLTEIRKIRDRPPTQERSHPER